MYGLATAHLQAKTGSRSLTIFAFRGRGYFKDAERRLIGKRAHQQRHGHIENRDTRARSALERPVVRMPMEHHVDRMTVQRLFQPAGAKVRVDLQRLALHRPLDWRIMKHCNALGRSQPGQGPLELVRLINRLLYEALDGRLAPRTQGRAPEPAQEALGAGNTGALLLVSLTIQHLDPGLCQDFADLDMLPGLEIVVAQHRDNGNFDGVSQLGDENVRLFGQAIVSEIAAQQEKIRPAIDGLEQGAQCTLGCFLDVEVAYSGQARRLLLTAQMEALIRALESNLHAHGRPG
jgi:hypothetical protein